MARIRFVCMSDLHFGDRESLLTALTPNRDDVDTTRPAIVAERLVDALEELRRMVWPNQEPKPTLVLNGDVLELALCATHIAAMVFRRFVRLVCGGADPLFDRIILIPGNHDHHQWETARERQYTEYLIRNGIASAIPPQWHTTPLLSFDAKHPVHAYLLEHLISPIKQENPALTLEIAYPNLACLRDDGNKMVVFHHGHFTESIYWLMSEVNSWIFPGEDEPRHVWDVERQNFAWIDFVWSALGRSWQSGAGLELVYEKRLSKRAFSKVKRNFAKGLAEEFDIPIMPEFAEPRIFEYLMDAIDWYIGRSERSSVDHYLSDDGLETLHRYVNGPVRRQIAYALKAQAEGKTVLDDTEDTDKILARVRIPETLFIFGHTHKPFEGCERFNLNAPRVPVEIYNTGGWIAESLKPEPIHGASIVLVNDELDATSLRMFNDERDPDEGFKVTVREARCNNRPASPFHTEIEHALDNGEVAESFEAFSEAAKADFTMRRENLKNRVLGKL